MLTLYLCARVTANSCHARQMCCQVLLCLAAHQLITFMHTVNPSRMTHSMQPVLWWRPTVTRSPSRMLQPSSSLQGPASDSRAVIRASSSGLYNPEVAAMTASWALSPLQAQDMPQAKQWALHSLIALMVSQSGPGVVCVCNVTAC
jgi:hypothetical protein